MTNTNVNAILPEINDDDARACYESNAAPWLQEWDQLSEDEQKLWRNYARAVRNSLSQRMSQSPTQAQPTLADVLVGIDTSRGFNPDDLKGGHWVPCDGKSCGSEHAFYQLMYNLDGLVIASWCFELYAEAQAVAEVKQIITEAAANQNQYIDAAEVLKALSNAGWTLAREDED